MNQYVALFRGINVGGHNRLPMGELRQALKELGLEHVESYIQSGNVVFKSREADPTALAEQIRGTVEDRFGFAPAVLVITAQALAEALAGNPYPEAEAEPKTLHLYFLQDQPQEPDLDQLQAVKKESEHYTLRDKVFYLHAPEGIGRSKLAEQVEKALGVPATARNWRTAEKIAALIQG